MTINSCVNWRLNDASTINWTKVDLVNGWVTSKLYDIYIYVDIRTANTDVHS